MPAPSRSYQALPAPPGQLDALRAELPTMLSDLRGLVEVESPSSDPAALDRSADAVGALGVQLLGDHAERLVRDGVPHLRWDLGDGPRRVLLLGHHDTVWPLGTLARMPWSVADGVVRGPGTFDMKAGIVVLLHGLVAARSGYGSDLDGVSVLITGDEEVGSRTSRELVEDAARGCRAALVTEGAAPGGAVKVERKGIGGYRLHVTGRAAHAGLEPHLGVNAGTELAHLLLAVPDLADPASGTTVTPTLARAGSSANTVPDSAELTLDVRAASRDELDRVEAGLRALRPHLEGATVRLSGGVNRPPMPAGSAGPLLQLAGAVAHGLGLPVPDGAAVGGGSDGNLAAGVGTPTLDGLGAEGGGAHADEEHVLVDSLATRTALVAGLVAALLADPAA